MRLVVHEADLLAPDRIDFARTDKVETFFQPPHACTEKVDPAFIILLIVLANWASILENGSIIPQISCERTRRRVARWLTSDANLLATHQRLSERHARLPTDTARLHATTVDTETRWQRYEPKISNNWYFVAELQLNGTIMARVLLGQLVNSVSIEQEKL